VAAAPFTATLVAHCRAGFEPEAAADLVALAGRAGATTVVDAPPGRGFVTAALTGSTPSRLQAALLAAPPVFIRSLFFGTGPHALFDPAATGRRRPDRVAPLAAAIAALRERDWPGVARGMAFGELRVEMPDTNEGKALSGLCRGVELPLAGALLEADAMAEVDEDATDAELARHPAVHVLFADGATAFVGVSAAPWRSRWPQGIPRLHMPRAAPSRSTLKLAEAFLTFLGDDAATLLRPGMKAVDLGAAPGGWTWQLAGRGLKVTAVDNGPLKGAVAEDSLVTHLRVDGLTYVPKRPVDWLVCDIAEQPAKIAALVARWVAQGDARRAIFNLKLPMKRRHAEVERCAALIHDTLRRARVPATLALKQLYHDREEVTGYLATPGSGRIK
jgi:23S rRNA (cytidine2498-2'-O)-methyltransferase